MWAQQDNVIKTTNKLSEIVDDNARSSVILNEFKLLQQCCCSAEYAMACN